MELVEGLMNEERSLMQVGESICVISWSDRVDLVGATANWGARRNATHARGL